MDGGALNHGKQSFQLTTSSDNLILTVGGSGSAPTPGVTDLYGNVGSVHVQSGNTAYLQGGASASDIQIDRGGVLVVPDSMVNRFLLPGEILI